jgi:hypothetical protein
MMNPAMAEQLVSTAILMVRGRPLGPMPCTMLRKNAYNVTKRKQPSVRDTLETGVRYGT